MSDTEPVPLRNFVAGQWVGGNGPSFDSTSPHDPSVVVGAGHHASCSQVDDAVTSAAAAQRDWSMTPAHERARHLVEAAAVVESRLQDWARELAREEGKPIGEARGEVTRAAQILRYHAGLADSVAGEIYSSPRKGEQILVSHRPVGVVAVISPFNFPIAIPAWKIGPALAYGNTVVWKPPASVALLATRLAWAFEQAGLPAGVLSLVHGEQEVGRALTEHPSIDAVTFTGSTAVGRAVASSCAARGVPTQAEMGGKNAALVLDDANLARAVDQVVAGAFRSAGQKCTATSRLIVQRGVADEFIDLLVAAVSHLTVGNPEDETVFVGPLISSASRDRVLAGVERAVSAGAERIYRGTIDPALGGHHVAPQILEVTDSSSELWTEELFGPVLAILRVDDIAGAIDAANAGDFGLSVAVLTSSLSVATQVMERVNVGMVHVNSETAGADPHVPFGGSKASALGPREQGSAARQFFTTTVTTYLKA